MTVVLVVMSLGTAGVAVVGNLGSSDNDLSWMVSVSGSWDGTNADLNGQLTDYLPGDVPGTGTFKQGRFPAGTYHGRWVMGDFVFYRVAEVVADRGEWREIIRHGRCGNPATGRYWHAYCVPKVREVEKVVEKVVEKPVEVVRVVEKPIVVERVIEKKAPCRPPPVNINITCVCWQPREAPRITLLGATRITTQSRGATFGLGAVWTRICTIKNPYCSPPEGPGPSPSSVPPDPARKAP